jgi:hypothetical protein
MLPLGSKTVSEARASVLQSVWGLIVLRLAQIVFSSEQEPLGPLAQT